MKEIDYKFYNELKSNSISSAQVPRSVRTSLHFKNLFDAGVIDKIKSGRGSRLIILKQDKFENFLRSCFPESLDETLTKASNIRKFRDSKAKRTESASIFFLRGFKTLQINGEEVDLKLSTTKFGMFSVTKPIFQTEQICFVENLDTFLKAETIFGYDYVFLHKYGRIGIESVRKITATKVIVFVDYDFNGLDEYIRIKSVYSNAELYTPENFQALFDRFGKSLKGKQKQSKKVLQSELKDVVQLRELVSKSNRFLEQEILIND